MRVIVSRFRFLFIDQDDEENRERKKNYDVQKKNKYTAVLTRLSFSLSV
jgi:hypothetical protein